MSSPPSVAVGALAVRPEQGPPLSIPMSFFAAGPVALAVGGVLLLLRADDGVSTVWAPSNVGLVHLSVVGYLLMTMVGALYQMLPVVAGALVPAPRHAHGVQAALVLGAGALVWGQVWGSGEAFLVALALLGAALVAFVGPAGYALARSKVSGPTSAGMKLALLGLVLVGGAGLRLAATRAGLPFEGNWLTLRWVHAHLGFIGWVGALVTAVSWQVLPMFFLVANPPKALAWSVFAGVALTVAGLAIALVVNLEPAWVTWVSAPGALAIWVVQPLWVQVALRGRRRKRRDATVWYWLAAMGAAPMCAAAAAAAAFVTSPRWPLAYGFLVVWAWAGTLVHGMLTRIVPFLVWLHRCAPLIGHSAQVPTAKDLLPDRQVAIGFWVHMLSVVCGAAAVATELMLAWRAFGGALVLVAVTMAWELASALRRAPSGRPVTAPR